MIEDKAFNLFLKAKLEEDITAPLVKSVGREAPIAPVCRLSAVLGKPICLLAASLAVICGVFSWQFVASNDASSERATLHAIALLDDSECIVSADTFAEKLLAWQDTPFDNIAN